MNNWQEELENEINTLNRPRRQYCRKSKKDGDFSDYALAFAVLAMTLLSFLVVYYKQPQIFGVNPTSVSVTAPKDQMIGVCDNLMVLKSNVDKMQTSLDSMQKRVWLLGIANNENAEIHEKKLNDSMIVFDSEWKLNRMPKYLQMDEATKQKLQGEVGR